MIEKVTYGLMRGRWKRNYESRTEAQTERVGKATGLYRMRASALLYRGGH
jgi:hypothetical protein